MQRLIILGSNGYLGNSLVKLFSKKFELFTSNRYSAEAEESNSFIFNFPDNVKSLESYLTDQTILINCIALANVERCQRTPELAYSLNVSLPEYLAKLSSKTGFKLIHISTDHFISKIDSKAKESSKIYPCNIYGKSKLDGEQAILGRNLNSIILRTNFFGHDYIHKNSLIDWFIKEVKSKRKVNGFSNIYFTPVSIGFLAETIINLLRFDFFGLINVSSDQCISKFDFLKKVAEIIGFESQCIIETKKEIFGELRRPNFMCLDNQLLISTLGRTVPTIDAMLREELINYKEWDFDLK